MQSKLFFLPLLFNFDLKSWVFFSYSCNFYDVKEKLSFLCVSNLFYSSNGFLLSRISWISWFILSGLAQSGGSVVLIELGRTISSESNSPFWLLLDYVSFRDCFVLNKIWFLMVWVFILIKGKILLLLLAGTDLFYCIFFVYFFFSALSFSR